MSCRILFVTLLVLSTGQGRGAEGEAAPADEKKWGGLQIRFTLEGSPPEQKKFDTSKEPLCAQLNVVDESLVVGAKGGIKNVFVWLVSSPPAVHPDVQAAAKKDVTLHIVGCRFEPRSTVVAVEQVLHLKSSDPFGHSVPLDSQDQPFSRIIPSGSDQSKSFKLSEPTPIPLECSIHPWMKGHLLIRPNLYGAVSNRDGLVTIAKLPVGKHTFCAWSERFLQGAKIGGEDAGWKKGRFEVEIKDGETTRFDVTVTPEVILGRKRAITNPNVTEGNKGNEVRRVLSSR